MKIYHPYHPEAVAKMDTASLRKNFLLDDLMQPDQVVLHYTHYDRAIIAGAYPVKATLSLPSPDQLKAEFFLQRREIGIINLGGVGQVITQQQVYTLDKLDALYLGQGEREVRFTSKDPADPALFFMVSAPAHQHYPSVHAVNANVEAVHLGSAENANRRTIFKYIHPDGIKSCQLVMGLTLLKEGSVWNTMPAHTHDRRMEAYFYFNIAANQAVMHLMGEPQETRHLWVKNYEAVISPPWSVHSGCGTENYGFIWAMAGENQSFTDMDGVAISDLR